MKKIRIISTYVENTDNALFLFNFSRDHLHIRGEYFPNYTLYSDHLHSCEEQYLF